MLGTIVDLFTGGAAGGLLGLLGTYLTRIEERKVAQLKFTHEEKMGELRLKEVEGERNHALALQDKKIEQAEVEGKIRIDEATVAGWASTLVDEASKSKFGAMVKATIRPIITMYLLGVSTYLAVNIWAITKGLEGLEHEELLDILRQILAQILFLTTTCVTWWFGARPSSQPKLEMKGVKNVAQ